MMSKKKSISILAVLLITTSLFIPLLQGVSGVDSPYSGPNIDMLTYKLLPIFGYEKEQTALLSGQVDMIPNIGSFEEAANLTANSNVTVYRSTACSSELSCIFFNLRRSPCNDTAMRQAVSYLVDRTYVCNTLLNGWTNPVRTFIPPISSNWTNQNALAPNFDTQKARQILDNAGYEVNSLGWRNTPNTNTTLPTLTVLTPTWSRSAVLWDIGYMISYYLNATGIPNQHMALPDYLLLERTMQSRTFDICVMDVSLSQVPFGLYALLHSSQDHSGTSAYPGIRNATLDAALNQLWFGNDKTQDQNAAKDAQTAISQLLPYIPVCSTPQISAVRSNWTGIVNMPGYGIDNIWTYLNVHKNNSAFGETLTVSALDNLTTLNPCTAQKVNEWSILQQIYSPLFYLDPQTMEETPMIANNWTITPWTTPQALNGTKITFNLKENVVWQDNEPFTSNDVKFCINYLKTNNASTHKSTYDKILNVNTPNSLTVEIFLNSTGYRFLYDMAWFTILPEHIWKNVINYQTFQPWSETNPLAPGLTKLVGQGPFEIKQTDLNSTATLVWNPLFFDKNPVKPSLIQKITPPQTATIGENVTFKHSVFNHTGSAFTAPNSGFYMTINKTDGSSSLKISTTYLNNGFETIVDTTKLNGVGSYLCTFFALPYGVESTTLMLTTTPTPTSNPEPPPIPETPILSVLMIIMAMGTTLLMLARKIDVSKTLIFHSELSFVVGGFVKVVYKKPIRIPAALSAG
jgi:peptide/nickel transport system substrate-binding protein